LKKRLIRLNNTLFAFYSLILMAKLKSGIKLTRKLGKMRSINIEIPLFYLINIT